MIPRDAPHPELAHAFIDFTLEAEIAAEICRDHALLDAEPRGAAAPARRDAREPRHLPAAPTCSRARS